jgi:hypothetical protein
MMNYWSAPEATGIAYYSQSIVQRDFLNTSKIDSTISQIQRDREQQISPSCTVDGES